ncbi:hypothetical protein ABPG74_000708 [Tetrahymena malaccensis]
MEQNNINPNRGLKAVVLGSTGAIGRVLVRELCSNNKWVEVSVIVRRKLNEWSNMQGSEKLKIIEVGSLDELQETEKWIQFRNYDSFFCTLGSRTKEGKDQFFKVDYTYCFWGAQIAEFNKIPHFSLLSSVGANAKSMFLYTKTKGQIEQAIKDLNFRYYSIFQPGFLRNRDNDSRCIEKFFQYCCCCCGPSIESLDCARAMIIEAEGRFSSSSEQFNRVITYTNAQMNVIAKN